MAGGTYFVYQTVRGRVTIASDGASITGLALGDAVLPGKRVSTAITNKAANQLQEYLAGKRRLFDVPVDARGTAFQRSVWHEIEQIPYGETRTYSQVAQAIGRPGASRAVGNAVNSNPVPIFIPCHRVVPASGGVGGYAYGPRVKEQLLRLEGALA